MAVRKTKPRRSSSRQSRGKANNIGWWAFFTVLAVVGVTGGYFAFSYAKSRPVIDQATLCPSEGPTGALIILLDLTDPLTAQQGARLRSLLERRVQLAQQGTMISFGVVSNDETHRGSLFSMCKPADGQMASQIYENPTLIAARFQNDFVEPLRAGLGEAMRTGVEDRSPIMESLQALIAETPSFETARGPRELVIVSDLLQHSEVLSFYRGEGWENLRAKGGTERLARTMNGAQVSVLKVPRPEASAAARNQVDDFWSRYFDAQGARAPIGISVLGDL